ncbi:MAG: hypothetical protein AMXMBFR53_12310 [Gemmatimonadota bacterium]
MLLHLHSGLRYLILLAGLAVILYALHGVIKKRPHDATMKNLAITFRSLMDVTLFTGIVVVMTGFGFYNDLGVHVILMLLATVVSHVVPAVMRKRKQEERTLLPYAVATAIALAMVALGVLSIAKPAAA